MKSFTTIDNLRTMFKEDFSKGYENQFVKLKKDITRELQESKRSLEDHKIEAMAIIKEHEHRELMADVALGISVSSMVMTLILTMTELSQNTNIQYVILLISIALMVGIFWASFMVLKLQRIKYKKVAYYAVKLYCIETMEKRAQTKVIVKKKRAKSKKGCCKCQ